MPGRTKRNPSAEPSLTDLLCTQCGLCCDGSLFADVELAGRKEAAGLELLGLEVEEERGHGAQLLQPCRALRGRRCAIYAHRPGCCRTFECGLLQDARRGAVSVERARRHIAETLERIERAKMLLGRMGRLDRSLPLRENCAEALVTPGAGGPGAGRDRARLKVVMAAIERRIRQVFLPRSA